jgi:hypothetical protein
MKKGETHYSGGVGFLGLLALLFIGLKLANVITWSWWVVLMPLYLPATIVLGVLLIIVIVVLIWGLFK